MSGFPWFKIHVEILDDPKMARLSDSEFRIWIGLIGMASESSTRGLIRVGDDLIAWRIRKDRGVVSAAIQKFEDAGMVRRVREGVELVNFDKRQYGAPSNAPERSRERKRRSRSSNNDDLHDVTRMSRPPVTAMSRGRVEQSRTEQSTTEQSTPRQFNEVPAREAPAVRTPEAVPRPVEFLSDLNPQPKTEAGLGIVSRCYEKLFGLTFAGKPMLQARTLLGRGVKPERIVEAYEAVMRAVPRPRLPQAAAMTLIENTPVGEPLVWQDMAKAGKRPDLGQAGLEALKTELERRGM